MKKLISLLFLVSTVTSLAEGTILIPLENGMYQRVNESEVMLPQEVMNNILEAKGNQELSYEKEWQAKKNTDLMPEQEFSLEDLFTLSLVYDSKEYEGKFKNNKNVYQNKVAEIFSKYSKVGKRVYQDEYTFDVVGIKNMYTYNNTDMDNLGGIVGGVYGITDNWNLKFSLGYMNTELNSTKADNFYTGIDLNYNSLAKADEIEYLYGIQLGYLNGKHDYFKNQDIMLGIAYWGMEVPLIDEYLYVNTLYETTLFSNKLSLGVRENIYLAKDIDIDIKVDGGYVFKYKDRDTHFYTHLDEEKATAKLEIGMNINNLEIIPYYEFVNKNTGICIEYNF